MSEETDGAGFLARWSRRKRAAAEPELPAEDRAPAAPPPAACPIPNLPEIDLASLPDIGTLTAESDFSLFLRPGVPGALRSAALRRMWSLDPAIRDYIGPVEYQWDFNTPGGLPLGFSGELVGDIGKLLAQAIGDVTKPLDGPAEEPAPEPNAEPLVSLRLEPPAPPEASLAEPVPEERPAPRRRHGGALPA